jgi:hypothetical protein
MLMKILDFYVRMLCPAFLFYKSLARPGASHICKNRKIFPERLLIALPLTIDN